MDICFFIFSISLLKLHQEHKNKVKVKVAQSCPTLCDPIYYTVHGILQARIPEWVAFPFSSRSSPSSNRTGVSYIAGRFFTSWATREVHKNKFLLKSTAYTLCYHFCYKGPVRKNKGIGCCLKSELDSTLAFNFLCTCPSVPSKVQRELIPAGGQLTLGPEGSSCCLQRAELPAGGGRGLGRAPPVHVHYPREDSLVHNVGETYQRQDEKTAFREFKISNRLCGKQGVSWVMKTQIKIKGIRSEARLTMCACEAFLKLLRSGKPSQRSVQRTGILHQSREAGNTSPCLGGTEMLTFLHSRGEGPPGQPVAPSPSSSGQGHISGINWKHGTIFHGHWQRQSTQDLQVESLKTKHTHAKTYNKTKKAPNHLQLPSDLKWIKMQPYIQWRPSVRA